MSTGLELLKKEMARRGLTKTQIESNAVYVTLSIISNDDRYIKLHELQNKIKNLLKKEDELAGSIQKLEFVRSSLEKEIFEKRVTLESKDYYDAADKVQEKIDKFNDCLKSGETEEGRDQLRKAQLFLQNVEVNTKYDNTAFIVGLASILSGGEISAIDELSKINTNFAKHFRSKEFIQYCREHNIVRKEVL